MNKTKKPRTIFVCSMADLFGDWVPDEWIEEVFSACEKAPQHRYIFLTKNPKRLCELAKNRKLPENDNFWYGTSVTHKGDLFFGQIPYNTFLSIEPLLGPPKGYKINPLYVETKNRRVQLLLTPSLHARVKEAAERNRESFNAYINRVLDEATQREE